MDTTYDSSIQRWFKVLWKPISALPSPIVLILLPFLAIWIYRLWFVQGFENVALWAAIAVVLFGPVDWGLLMVLPRLQLSFGEVGIPLLGISAVRLLVSLLVGWLWPESYVPMVAVALVWLINLFILGCEVYGLYFEPFKLGVTRLDIAIAPTASENYPILRILHLTDLHIERLTQREHMLLEQMSMLQPDLIVLTGDYLNITYTDDPLARQEARWLLSQLRAPLGVFAVSAKGVDPVDTMAALFDGLEIRVLLDQALRLPLDGHEIWLIGIPNLGQARDQAALQSLMPQVPPGSFTILLYHRPDLVEVAAQVGVGLQLSGHTHGGQLRLPGWGALVTGSSFYKKYEMGRYQVGPTTLYVSRGIGMEGRGMPRARFLCPPEMVEVRLCN